MLSTSLNSKEAHGSYHYSLILPVQSNACAASFIVSSAHVLEAHESPTGLSQAVWNARGSIMQAPSSCVSLQEIRHLNCKQLFTLTSPCLELGFPAELCCCKKDFPGWLLSKLHSLLLCPCDEKDQEDTCQMRACH